MIIQMQHIPCGLIIKTPGFEQFEFFVIVGSCYQFLLLVPFRKHIKRK